MIECQVTQGCEVGITVRHNCKGGHSDCFASVFIVTAKLN